MIVIFDWDGTLCDSAEQIVSAMQNAAIERSLVPAPAAAIRDLIGLSLPRAVLALYPAQSAASCEAFATAYSRHYVAADQAPGLFDGALATLHQLRSLGVELAVATGKSRRGLNRVLNHLDLSGFFDITRCADETQSKPDPQMLHEIMRARHKAPTDVLMIGDSEYDLEMARNAGVNSIGVSFGVHSPQRLARHQPLEIVDQLPQLLDIVMRYRQRLSAAENLDAGPGQ